jgi:hypothetical protein
MAIEKLGQVTIKSGVLAILDFGFAPAFSGSPAGALRRGLRDAGVMAGMRQVNGRG